MTFQPEQSGNPAGRPKGARGKAAVFAEGLFEGEAEEIIREAVKMAKRGDITAIRVCLDRIAPHRRDRAVPFELPALHSAESALSALAEIAAAVSRGDLTPAEADNISKQVVQRAEAGRAIRSSRKISFGRTGRTRCGARTPSPDGRACAPVSTPVRAH
jgi:hypothetical protein